MYSYVHEYLYLRNDLVFTRLFILAELIIYLMCCLEYLLCGLVGIFLLICRLGITGFSTKESASHLMRYLDVNMNHLDNNIMNNHYYLSFF